MTDFNKRSRNISERKIRESHTRTRLACARPVQQHAIQWEINAKAVFDE